MKINKKKEKQNILIVKSTIANYYLLTFEISYKKFIILIEYLDKKLS